MPSPARARLTPAGPWLAREIELVKPRVVVCMGATAGQALFGRAFRLGRTRGKNLRDTSWAPIVMATFHPSAILRMPDRKVAEQQYQEFVKDLRRAKKLGASARTG